MLTKSTRFVQISVRITIRILIMWLDETAQLIVFPVYKIYMKLLTDQMENYLVSFQYDLNFFDQKFDMSRG